MSINFLQWFFRKDYSLVMFQEQNVGSILPNGTLNLHLRNLSVSEAGTVFILELMKFYESNIDIILFEDSFVTNTIV